MTRYMYSAPFAKRAGHINFHWYLYCMFLPHLNQAQPNGHSCSQGGIFSPTSVQEEEYRMFRVNHFRMKTES